MARRRTACHGFYHLVYFEFNIAGIGSDLAAAAGDRLGDLHRSHIGLGEKYLIGKQTACHIARTGPDEDLRCGCPYSDREIRQILTEVSISIFKSIREIPGFSADAFDRDAVFSALIGRDASELQRDLPPREEKR